MLAEDLDERFKDADDPFRLMFVCAMWMTGFDIPSCSTIYDHGLSVYDADSSPLAGMAVAVAPPPVITAAADTEGGTLFIGVDDQRRPTGLSCDTALVKPPNADGLVNWLSTHLANALTHAAVMHTRARIDVAESSCRSTRG